MMLTIKTEELKKKKRISLEYTNTFLSTPLKCDGSKRLMLPMNKWIAAREYSGITNQLLHDRGDTRRVECLTHRVYHYDPGTSRTKSF